MNTTKSDIIVEPYLSFDGRCEEAIEFYKRAVGAKVNMLMRFKDNPEPQKSMCAPGSENQIMHASLTIGGSNVMVSDGRCTGKTSFQGFSLALSVSTKEEAEKFFAALSEGGQVQMTLEKTFFSPAFGMVSDKFGVCWMILVRH